MSFKTCTFAYGMVALGRHPVTLTVNCSMDENNPYIFLLEKENHASP